MAGAREASSHNEHENSSNNSALARVSYKSSLGRAVGGVSSFVVTGSYPMLRPCRFYI